MIIEATSRSIHSSCAAVGFATGVGEIEAPGGGEDHAKWGADGNVEGLSGFASGVMDREELIDELGVGLNTTEGVYSKVRQNASSAFEFGTSLRVGGENLHQASTGLGFLGG